MNRCLTALAALGLVALSAAGHPIVPAFERFHADGSARGGRLLLTELACIRCHKADDASLRERQGPVLTDVASRVRVGWLRKYLADPHKVKPGTTMPDVLAGDPQRESKAEALLHLLASTGSIKHERSKSAALGRDVYSKLGCVACHGSRDAGGKQDRVLPSSVPLGDLHAKYTQAGLARFLENPLHSRPSGRMPKLLDGKQAADVASYLLQGQKLGVQGGSGTTRYQYFEGSWGKLPDFSKLRPAGEGIADGFSLGVAGRGHDYALVFEGYFSIPKDGKYSFTLNSDDGSKLYIDGKLVVDNDGVHAPQTRGGSVSLTKGVHRARVEFFQGGGGAELAVLMNKKPLGDLVSANEEGVGKPQVVQGAEEDVLAIDPEKVKQGALVFTQAGCASCHQLSIKGKPLEGAMKAEPVAKLTDGKGCLSEKPTRGAPWYGLSAAQKKSIVAAVKDWPEARAPKDVLTDTLATYNCYACHSRDRVGGVPDDLNKLVTSVQPEMGDEGRLPPPLDGAGAKLRPEYVREIVEAGAHHRPYMHTRMPGFGAAAARGLAEALEALDKLPEVKAPEFKEPPSRVKSIARHLVGAKAFGCIKCHTFAGQKAEGVQGIDMALMTKRLKRDWFHAYVTDPQTVRPGTRMPSGFQGGKSLLPDILDGSAAQQVEAMWLYLSDGTKAALPIGVGGGKLIPLVPEATAIIYRNFIAGAGSRAIAVGYPERLHLAFDANEMRIAMMWHGEFINAGRHWNGRGEGAEPPLGDSILRLHGGAGFARLASDDAPWPTGAPRSNGYRFRGYKLDEQDRPTFLYSLNGAEIEDRPNPVARGKEVVMTRAIAISGVTDGPLTFRAAVGDRAEALKDGWFAVDTFKVKLPGGRIRKVGGKQEVVLDVPLKDGKGSFSVEYSW
jgi:cytochrome c553